MTEESSRQPYSLPISARFTNHETYQENETLMKGAAKINGAVGNMKKIIFFCKFKIFMSISIRRQND
jgi:hypothetical protein